MTALQKVFFRLKKQKVPFSQSESFSRLTTLGTGGKILLTVYPKTEKQLVAVAKLLFRHKVKHCFLGHGSNVLASDDAYNGVAVVTTGVSGVQVVGQTVYALCGTSTAKLCTELLKHGLSGGEFFGCLPATVGGAVSCNAGCFGQSVSQVVKSVTVLHKGRRKKLPAKKCKFSVRNSLFKNNGNFVVLGAQMQFVPKPPSQIKERLENMRKTKNATQPLSVRSAGCVLYSDNVAVSKLTDQAGLKGYTLGGAQVSEKHAGFVINVDKATSKDIYLLIQYIKKTLWQQFGVSAHTELCLVNFPQGQQL